MREHLSPIASAQPIQFDRVKKQESNVQFPAPAKKQTEMSVFMIFPSAGKAMVDVILQSSETDAPELKDCLPVIGALKHLREWHAAKISIVANKSNR